MRLAVQVREPEAVRFPAVGNEVGRGGCFPFHAVVEDECEVTTGRQRLIAGRVTAAYSWPLIVTISPSAGS